MQVTAPQEPQDKVSIGRKIGYLLLPILITLAVLTMILAFLAGQYRIEHEDRIMTGVSVAGVDLSGMTAEEAEEALAAVFPYAEEGEIVFEDPVTGQKWSKSAAQLGISINQDQILQEAMAIGRSGSPLNRTKAMFDAWYYGQDIAPVILLNEAQIDETINELAGEINQPAVDATINYQDNAAEFNSGQPGRELDTAELRSRLIQPVSEFRNAQVGLLVHEIYPELYDDSEVAQEIQNTLDSPMSFYLAEPLDELDLQPVELPQDLLASWLRVDVQEQGDGSLLREVIVDENAVRHWLRQFEDQIYRDPVNARFYFDDDTRDLVLVAPHVNGRSLNMDATVAQFLEKVGTSNRAVPFIVDAIEPTVHSGATAGGLGITELITETTTWFYGSTDERKHNIARAAANFFGIVVAPGEEFSFNKYLGSVSDADGYEEGFIIVGGRTFRGIGGGVCQVSTTLYQNAFLSGFPITERWEHGFRLQYYDDGEGPGMDATVFSPIVDMKFINNTPHHLLIENYYNTEFEALTFKMYSTNMGRTVEKTFPVFENIVPAPEEDVWEYDPELPEGTVVWVESAVEGADVFVDRIVYNADGEKIIDETVVSNYIPNPNVFHYGPGVEPYDYSLVPGWNE